MVALKHAPAHALGVLVREKVAILVRLKRVEIAALKHVVMTITGDLV